MGALRQNGAGQEDERTGDGGEGAHEADLRLRGAEGDDVNADVVDNDVVTGRGEEAIKPEPVHVVLVLFGEGTTPRPADGDIGEPFFSSGNKCGNAHKVLLYLMLAIFGLKRS